MNEPSSPSSSSSSSSSLSGTAEVSDALKFKLAALQEFRTSHIPSVNRSLSEIAQSVFTGVAGGAMYGAFKTYRDVILVPAAQPETDMGSTKQGKYTRAPIKFGSSGTPGALSGAERNALLRKNIPLFRANMLGGVKQFSLLLGVLALVDHGMAHFVTNEHRPINGVVAGAITGAAFGMTVSGVHAAIGGIGLAFVHGGLSNLRDKVTQVAIATYTEELKKENVAIP